MTTNFCKKKFTKYTRHQNTHTLTFSPHTYYTIHTVVIHKFIPKDKTQVCVIYYWKVYDRNFGFLREISFTTLKENKNSEDCL